MSTNTLVTSNLVFRVKGTTNLSTVTIPFPAESEHRWASGNPWTSATRELIKLSRFSVIAKT